MFVFLDPTMFIFTPSKVRSPVCWGNWGRFCQVPDYSIIETLSIYSLEYKRFILLVKVIVKEFNFSIVHICSPSCGKIYVSLLRLFILIFNAQFLLWLTSLFIFSVKEHLILYHLICLTRLKNL